MADLTLAMELSEAGVILLMFGVGLHFKLEDLLAVKGISVPGAIFQSTVATVCGFAMAELMGMTVAAGLLMGMGLAVASTVVLLRVLEDNNMLDSVHGHVAVGWLVMEDILTVLILVLLPSLALILNVSGTGESMGWLPMAQAVGLALLRLALLWGIVLVVGGRVVPWVLTQVVRTRSQELFTLTVLVAAFATAVAAAVFFEASVALGAFLGGMVVGKSNVSHQAGADLLPFRDAFAVLFFLSVGMLLDPGFVLERPGLIAAALAIVLIVKPLAAVFIVALCGYSARTGLVVGVSLAQVGEFSFILAQQAYNLQMIPIAVYNVLVVCAIVSITLNPGLFRMVPKFENALKGIPWLWGVLNTRANKKAGKKGLEKLTYFPGNGSSNAIAEEANVIIVGYGPAGKSVAEALGKSDCSTTIIDLNVDTVNFLNEQGKQAVYGDASRPEVLRAAGIEKARYLVLSLPGLEETAVTTAVARRLNGDLRILARVRFLKDQELLKSSGANAVVFEEEEVARTLADTVLEDIRKCAEETCPVYFEDEVA